MRILRRYISTSVISAILLITFMLISIQVFISFSQEFPDIGTGSYTLSHALLYVLMTLPSGVYQFFPIAGLLGSLIGLGILASRSELVVMRCSGVSILKITWIVLRATLILMVVAVILGEYLGPSLQRHATAYKAESMSQGQALHTAHGIWLRKGKDFIHIAALLPGHKMTNITKYKFDANHNLETTTIAKSGNYQHGDWIFSDVTSSNFSSNGISNTHFAKQSWNLRLAPHLLNVIKIDSSERSLPQLYSYIKYRHYSGLNANKYEFQFWQRILQPLATLVMILLAIPFIFGPLRTVSMGLRIMAGTVTGLCFYILNQFLAPITVVFQLPPLLVAILPIALVAALGLFLIARAK